MQWKILAQETAYQGFFKLEKYQFEYARFHGGTYVVTREVFERGNAAAVLPYDPQRDAVVLVEQFRPGAIRSDQSPWLIELIAGMMSMEENAAEVVRREALEEAKCYLSAIEPIAEYLVSPGGTTEKVSLFCACTNSEGLGGVHGLAAEHEDIRVHVIPRLQAMEWMAKGRLNNAMSLIALLWLEQHYQRLQTQWR
ncbi:MAG: NUDIX domain-containing protein [Gammaproteobacteria bacterium]|nr:NUDIX domain-containing protein [Gammaproteobacteria bacterium]